MRRLRVKTAIDRSDRLCDRRDIFSEIRLRAEIRLRHAKRSITPNQAGEAWPSYAQNARRRAEIQRFSVRHQVQFLVFYTPSPAPGVHHDSAARFTSYSAREESHLRSD